MSDTEHVDPVEGEKLRYAGGTTRHDGPGDKPKTLPKVDASDLGIDDIQPGVGNAQENRPPSE